MEKFNSNKLEKLTRKDLVSITKHYSLRGYSKLSKAELIELITPFLQASFHGCYEVASRLNNCHDLETSPFYEKRRTIKYGLFGAWYFYEDYNSKVTNPNEYQAFTIYIETENTVIDLGTYLYNEKAKYDRILQRWTIK